MAIQKREALSRMLRAWLATNRNGKLTSDQWLNLVTSPLLTLVVLGVPLILLLTYTPLRVMLQLQTFGRYIVPLFIIGVVAMLVLRARHYARLPVYQGIFYPDATHTAWTWLRRRLIVYTEKGRPVVFNRFASNPPHLEPDMPYLVYYLEEGDQRTWLSFAPMHHPDIDAWQPSDKFFERQEKRKT